MGCLSRYDLPCCTDHRGDYRKGSCDAAENAQSNPLGAIYSRVSFVKRLLLRLTLWIHAHSILPGDARRGMQVDAGTVNRDHSVHEVDVGARGCNGRRTQPAS